MSDKNKEIVTNVNKSFEEGTTETFLGYCADDVTWAMVGEKSVRGKTAIREWMKQMDGMEPPVLTINNLISDGDTVVCTGDMTMKDSKGNTAEYGYCDIYRFNDDKISELTSFMIKSKADGAEVAAA